MSKESSNNKGFVEKMRELTVKEKIVLGIRSVVRAFVLTLALTSCDGNNDNNPDGGTDTDTNTPADCSNTEYELGTFPAEKCFCPGDGDQVLEMEGTGSLLDGIKARFKEGTFDECVIAIMANANFPDDATAVDEDGAVVDAQNPDNKILSTDGVEYKAISTSDPYDSESTSGYNEIQPNIEVEFEFPEWYGTVMKWIPDDGVPHFEAVNPTTVDADGTTYMTDSFSAYAVHNKPFSSFTTNFVSGDTNGYDVNEDGVLVQIGVEDEGQSALVSSQLAVSDGTNTYELIPTGEPGKYRVPVFEGSHNLKFVATDKNGQTEYTHSAEDTKSIDLDEDLCDGVDYDDGDACNGVEDCDPSDGSMIPGTPIDHDDGDACNGEEGCDPDDGSMIPGEDVICEDDNDCTTDTCIPADGSCDYDPLPNVGNTCDDMDAGTENDVCQTDGSCEGTEIPPNTPPAISSLGASPNPCSSYDSTAITFNINDADGDDVDWEIDLTNGLDGILATGDGTCDTDTHCSGTVTGGSGTVNVTFNTGDTTNATIEVDADDGNGGSDTEGPYIIGVQ